MSLIENNNQNKNLSTSTQLNVNAKWMIENKTELATRKTKDKKVEFCPVVEETPFNEDGIDRNNQKQKTLKTSNLYSEVVHRKNKS